MKRFTQILVFTVIITLIFTCCGCSNNNTMLLNTLSLLLAKTQTALYAFFTVIPSISACP